MEQYPMTTIADFINQIMSGILITGTGIAISLITLRMVIRIFRTFAYDSEHWDSATYTTNKIVREHWLLAERNGAATSKTWTLPNSWSDPFYQHKLHVKMALRKARKWRR